MLSEAANQIQSSVRLNHPVPLDQPVYLHRDHDWAALRHCDITLAETLDSSIELREASGVDREELARSKDWEVDMGPFADCFVCGRNDENSLGVRPKPVSNSRFAAVWHPASSALIDTPTVPERYLRSVLDCPGGFAVIAHTGYLAVTGSLTTRIDSLPEADQLLTIVAEPSGADGRKLKALTTVFDEANRVVATGEAIWISIEAAPIKPAA